MPQCPGGDAAHACEVRLIEPASKHFFNLKTCRDSGQLLSCFPALAKNAFGKPADPAAFREFSPMAQILMIVEACGMQKTLLATVPYSLFACASRKLLPNVVQTRSQG
jgi:hypothetical protein